MSETTISSPSEAGAGTVVIADRVGRAVRAGRAEPLSLVPAAPTLRQRALLVLLAVVVLGSLAWWVSKSPVFELKDVHVRGAAHFSTAQIERMAGLSDHTNVLWLSASGVQRRLERSPWILSATASRSLPAGVTITVVERAPAATIEVGGRSYLISGDGVVLAPAGQRTSLPQAEVQARSVEPGTRLSPVPATVAAVASLPASLRHRAALAWLDERGSVQLSLRGGPTVDFGDATEGRQKALVLQSLLKWSQRHGVHPSVVDVSAPDAPALLAQGTVQGTGT